MTENNTANKNNRQTGIIEREFEELNEYIQDLWQFLPLPMLNSNPKGIVIDTNRAMETLTGYSLTEIIGKPTASFFSPLKSEKIVSETLARRPLSGFETEILTKSGEKISATIHTRVREDKNGNIIGFFLSAIDIRETKKFQEKLEQKVQEKTKELIKKTHELEQSGKALMNILEDINEAKEEAEEEKNKTLAIITNFADGLIFLSKDSRISIVNPQAEKLLKVNKENIIGKAIAEIASQPAIGEIIALLDNKKQVILRNEVEIYENQNLEISVIPVARDEEFLGTIIIIHDITREKLVEKMKTEFVSLTAHQLRTPLSAIKWTLRMIIDNDLGPINEEQKNFLQKTYNSNERMIRLINDLLNVTRIEEGKFIYKPSSAQISDIIHSVISSLQDKINNKKISLKFTPSKKPLPLIKIDEEKIQIAINNLIDNAIDYTPEKGSIIIEASANEKNINFSVKDTGVGIPKEQQHRIFSKFFRGENVIKMETDGTGLGTFIAKNIIEAHNGKIWFESTENKGTTFFFTLPIE